MTTATTLPFYGGEMGSFDPRDANSVEYTGVIPITSQPSFDSAFARCSIQVNGEISDIGSPAWPAASPFWFHGRTAIRAGSTHQGIPNLYLLEGATVVGQVNNNYDNINNTNTLLIYSKNGSGGLALRGSFLLNSGIPNNVDIRLQAGAAGKVALYVADNQKFEVTGLDHTGFTGVTSIIPAGTYEQAYWSEIICDNKPTVGDRLATYHIDTLSATNHGMTGTVSDVNEIVYNDANFNAAASADLTSTYFDSTADFGAYYVKGIGLGVRAKCGVGGPQNLQLVLRVAGTNYNGPSIPLATGYQACAHAWAVNPATGLPWVTATAEGVEGGQESKA